MTQRFKLKGVALFNSRGQFLQEITKKRAVTLLFAQQATSICPTLEIWKSPSVEITIPKAVLLVGRAEKFYRKEQTFTPEKMKKRDNHTCQYCGSNKGAMTVDHIQPQSRGGKNTWENCVTSCEKCNHKKADRTPKEAGMHLLSSPTKPPVVDDAEIWEQILNSDYELVDDEPAEITYEVIDMEVQLEKVAKSLGVDYKRRK
jgi:5-methylcytosine-specific restriction endonuclease McrA